MLPTSPHFRNWTTEGCFPRCQPFCKKGEICVGDTIQSVLCNSLLDWRGKSGWECNWRWCFAESTSASPPTWVLPGFGKGQVSSDAAPCNTNDESVRQHIRMRANLFSDDSEQKPTENHVDRQPSVRHSSYLNNWTCSWRASYSSVQGAHCSHWVTCCYRHWWVKSAWHS